MGSYDVRCRAAASPALVWSALIDGRTWPMWSKIDEYVSDRSSPGPAEKDAVRTFRTGDVVSVERIVDLSTERRLVYEGVENPVLRDYFAFVELHLDPSGGTELRWAGIFRTRPGMGFFMSQYLRRFQGSSLDGLAEFASKTISPRR